MHFGLLLQWAQAMLTCINLRTRMPNDLKTSMYNCCWCHVIKLDLPDGGANAFCQVNAPAVIIWYYLCQLGAAWSMPKPKLLANLTCMWKNMLLRTTQHFGIPKNGLHASCEPFPHGPVGLMDKASASGAGDSRFESWAGQNFGGLHGLSQALVRERQSTLHELCRQLSNFLITLKAEH